MTKSKPCYFCEKVDEQTFPTIIPTVDFDDHLEWICRRHMWPGHIMIHAFTGLPFIMIGREEDYSHKEG